MEKIQTVTRVVEGETYNRTFQVEGNIVWMSQVTELKDGKHYFKFGLDLSNLDDTTIKRHAAKDINIVVLRPRVFKTKTAAEVAELPNVFDPNDYPATRGGGIDKREAGIRTLVDTIGLPRELAEKVYDKPKGAHKIISAFLAQRSNMVIDSNTEK